jgi:large subunit ribosomal protein L5e
MTHVFVCSLLPQVHEAIRANPVSEKKARSKPAEAKRWQPAKLTYEERKERLSAKLNTLMEADDE